ncbi:MAG: hypothetical protein AUG51_24430 [Acidobacteria bacterium 13_1_20CM_3_53_8]|nr:MAG: hypothetical protein AUG51_24430 [Acidobacteria bacterium 13_1_20CM_3_53_8]
MRKILVSALIVLSLFAFAFAQGGSNQTPDMGDELRLGHAPSQPDGIGRAVIQVFDEQGNPIKGAYLKLQSLWGEDNLCESYGWTNEHGVIALPPIHMGTLKLKVKAKGYKTQELTVNPGSLGDPVHITLTRK